MSDSNPIEKPLDNNAACENPPAEILSPTVLVFVNVSGVWNGYEFEQGAGIAIVHLDSQRISLKAQYLGALTGQKAAILACAEALESLKQPSVVHLFAGSYYVVGTMLGRSETKTNRVFWNRLVKACLTNKISWNFVPGTPDDPFQATAQRLSRAAALAKGDLDKKTVLRLATMLQGAPDQETVQMIHTGIKTLAAACDGAVKADGKGFDKFDSELGKQFAGKSVLTPREALAARGLMKKYRTQIAGFDKELALLL